MNIKEKISKLINLIEDMESNDYLGYRLDFKSNYEDAMNLMNELEIEINNISNLLTG